MCRIMKNARNNVSSNQIKQDIVDQKKNRHVLLLWFNGYMNDGNANANTESNK